MILTRQLAVAAVAAVVSLGVATPVARADKPDTAPCAQEQSHVDQAQAALDRVTAVFEHQKTKVERLQEALAAATTPEEQARIQARLDRALAKEQHTKKAKKAQQKRLEKAEARLAACLAANPA